MRLPALAALVALSLPPAALAAGGGWHRIEEAEFNAEFPGEPKLEQTSEQTEAGPTTTSSWDWSTPDDSTYFSVSFTQYAQGALSETKPREVLDRARDASLKGAKAKPTASKAITLAVGGQKYPGLEYEGTTPQGFKLSARLVLVADRMYQLIDVRQVAEPHDEDFRRFTQAFELKRVSEGLDPDAPVAEAVPDAAAAGADAPRVTGHHQPSPKKRKK